MRKRIKNLEPGDRIIDHGHGYRKANLVLSVRHGEGYTAIACEGCTYVFFDYSDRKRVKVLDPSDADESTIES